MKKILAVAMTAVGCATIASAGVANSISGIHSVKTHYPWDGKVEINYTSTDPSGSGRILLDVGPTKRCITLTEADIVVGNHTKTYDLHEMFGEFKAEVLASVDYVSSQLPDDATGNPTGILGDLMTIKLDSATKKYDVNTYTNVDLGKFNCDTYKATKLALLRIPAGRIWPARPGSSETDTIVTTTAPTNDYWISIFPVTGCQYQLVKEWDTWTGFVFNSRTPSCEKYNNIRNGFGDSVPTSWPMDSVAEESFMGRLAQATKHCLNGKFDLPTEMQWEIAARAGSTSPYGHYIEGGAPQEGTTSNAYLFAWFTGYPQNVGGRRPNMWGLYDMMGNYYEWCLDQYEAEVEWNDVETPHYNGPSDKRVIRGGWYKSEVGECRPSYRASRAAGAAFNSSEDERSTGFRVCFMPK